MKKRYAVFDIDGTIARTSLLQQLVHVLVSRGRLDLGPAEEIEIMLHDFRQRIGDDDFGNYMKKAVDIVFKSVPSGITIEEYSDLIDTVVKTSLSHTYVYTRQLIQSLKRSNYFLISISGSEKQIVSTFSKALGFDAWVGQVQYIDDGIKLTGEMRSLDQPKDLILKTLINKFDLDTTESMAVGDTSIDIPLLKLVDNPIVFNPNQELFEVANKNKWMIIIERKDMVYGLQSENDQYVLKQTNLS